METTVRSTGSWRQDLQPAGRGHPLRTRRSPSRLSARSDYEENLLGSDDDAASDYQEQTDSAPTRKRRGRRVRRRDDEDPQERLQGALKRAERAERRLRRTLFFVAVVVGVGLLVGMLLLGIELAKPKDDDDVKAAPGNTIIINSGQVQCKVDGCSGLPEATKDVCMAGGLSNEVDRLKAFALYENIREEQALVGKGDSVKLTTRSLLNWTDSAGAAIFNAWGHDTKRPGYDITLEHPNITLEEPTGEDRENRPTVRITGTSEAYGTKLQENISLEYRDNSLAIKSKSFSPAGEELDLSAVTGANTAWQDYVGTEAVTLNAENHQQLLGAEETKAIGQEMTMESDLPVVAAVDAVSFMGLGSKGQSAHVHVHMEEGRIHKLSGTSQHSLAVSGTISKNGQQQVAVKTETIAGPLGVANVRLYNMSLTLTAGDDYIFAASAEFDMGRKTFQVDLNGVVGYQPRKGQDDLQAHSVKITGRTEKIVLLEGDRTELKAAPLEVRLSGFLECGLAACDGSSPLPCIELELPQDTAGPNLPSPSTLVFNGTTSGPTNVTDPVTYARWRVDAFVSGKLSFGDKVKADFEFPLLSNGELFGTSRTMNVELNDLQLSAAVLLKSGELRWHWSDGDLESAVLSFGVEFDAGDQQLTMACEGRALPGKLDLKGSLSNWRVPFGPGFTVDNLVAAVSVQWEVDYVPMTRCGWEAAGSLAIHSKHHIQRPDGACPSMSEQKTYTESMCRKACEEEPLCSSYEFTPSLGQCCLLDCFVGEGQCKGEPTSRTKHSVFNCKPRGKVPGFVGPFGDHGITGYNDLDVINDVDYSDCATRCAAKSQCLSFEYMSDTQSDIYRSCWLSSANREFTPSSTWQVWPGWDYYEKHDAHRNSSAAGSFAVNHSSSDPQLHSANLTRLAQRKWDVQLNSTLDFGGAKWDFSFALSNRQTEGSYIQLIAKDPSANLLNLATGTFGASPVSDPTGLLQQMSPTGVRIFLRPLWLRATVNSYILKSGLRVFGTLSVRQHASGWRWGLCVQTHPPENPAQPGDEIVGFRLSDLIPDVPKSFDGVVFTHGMFAVANEPMNVTVISALDGFHDLPKVMEVGPGFVVSATVALTDIAPVRPAQTNEVRRYVRMKGTYKHGEAKRLALYASYENEMEMTSDIRLNSLRLKLVADSAEGLLITFQGNATLVTAQLGMADGELSVSGKLRTTNKTQEVSATGTIGNWRVTDDIIVSSGSASINLQRNHSKITDNSTAAWGKWDVQGHVNAKFSLHGMILALRFPIPLNSGITSISAAMPVMNIAPGVDLIDVKTAASFSGDISSFVKAANAWDLQISSTLRIKNPASSTGTNEISVAGQIGKGTWSLMGSAPEINIASAITLTDVALNVSGTYGNSTPASLSASVAANIEIFGKNAAAWAKFTKGAGGMAIDGDVTFPKTPGRSAHDLAIGGRIPLGASCFLEMDKLDFEVRVGLFYFKAGAIFTCSANPMTLELSARIAGPQTTAANKVLPKWVPFNIKELNELNALRTNWSYTEFNGSATNWKLSDSFTVNDVSFELQLVKENSIRVRQGNVRGSITWSGLTLGANIPIPVSSGDTIISARAEEMSFGSAVKVKDLDITYTGVLTSFITSSTLVGKGTLEIDTGFSNDGKPLTLQFDGTFSRTRVDVTGRLANWKIMDALTINDVVVTAAARFQPPRANASACFTDPVTGTCEPALCYEAMPKRFPLCTDYDLAGYNCSGDWCARDGCGGDCSDCADRFVGKVADPATGRCVTPYALESGRIQAKASFMGMAVGSLDAQIPWDETGYLEISVQNLELAPSVEISGGLRIQRYAPQVQMNATLDVLGGVFPMTLVGGATNESQYASLSIERAGSSSRQWDAPGGFQVRDVDIKLNLERSWDHTTGAWGGLDVTGRLMGKLDFSFIYLEVDVPIPPTSGTITLGAEVPPFSVGPGALLSMTLHGQTQGANFTELLKTVKIQTTAQLNVSSIGAGGEPASFNLAGTFGQNELALQGTATEWEIVPGLVLRSLAIDVLNTRAAGAHNVSVAIDAELDSPLGNGIKASASFEYVQGAVSFAVGLTGPIDIGGFKVNKMQLIFPGNNGPVTFEGEAELPSFQGGSPGLFQISGYYQSVNNSRLFGIDGSCTNWEFAPGFAITALNANIDVSKPINASLDPNVTTTYEGEITGDFMLGGVQLLASVPIPISSGPVTAEVPSLRLAPGVRIDNLGLKVGNIKNLGPGVSAEVKGTLVFTVPGAPQPEISFAVTGTFGNGAFSITGTLSEWTIVKGLTLKTVQIAATGTSVNGSIDAELRIDADVEVFGKLARLWAKATKGAGKSLEFKGDVKFPKGSQNIGFGEVIKTKARNARALGSVSDIKLGSITVERLDFKYSKGVFEFDTNITYDTEPRPAKLRVDGVILSVSNSSALAGKVPADLLDDLLEQELITGEKLQYARLHGKAEQWEISDSVAIERIEADISIARTNGTSISGWVEGEVVLGGFTLSAHVPIPPTRGVTEVAVNWTSIDMGPVELTEGYMKYEGVLSDFANSSKVDLHSYARIDTPFAEDPHINIEMEGHATADLISLSGRAYDWRINGGLTLEELSASGQLVKADGKWGIKNGRISASGLFLGGRASVVSPFPFTNTSTLRVDATNLKIAPGVTLTTATVFVRRQAPQFEMDAMLAMGKATSLNLNGSAGFTDVSQEVNMIARFTEGDTWEVGAGIAIEDVNCDLALTRTRATKAAAWESWNVTGLLQGGFSWANNLRISAYVPIPLDDQTVLTAEMMALNLGDAVTIGDARLEYRGDLSNFVDDPKITVGMWVNISTPFAVDDHLPIRVDGFFSKKKMTGTGRIPKWEVVTDMLGFEDIKATFTAEKISGAPVVQQSTRSCFEARIADYPPADCFGWDVNGYFCAGDWCARDSNTPDGCSVEKPGYWADPDTGRCVELLCYEARPDVYSNCTGYNALNYNCAGDFCAIDGCVGDCQECAEKKLGFAADVSTGTCIQAVCYEADVGSFPKTCDYSGYTCVGDDCAASSCIGDCNSCARRRMGYQLDPTTGKCSGGRWELTEAVAEGGGTLLGSTLDRVVVNLTDGLSVNISGWQLNKDCVVTKGLLQVPKGGPISFEAEASLGVGGGTFIQPQIKGTVHNSSHFEVSGSFAAGWELMGLRVKEVGVNLACTPGSSGTDCLGNVYGSMSIFDTIVEVDVPIPLSSGNLEIRLPRLVLAENTFLEDGLLRRTPQNEFLIEGKVHLKVSELATPLIFEATAVVTTGCFEIRGSTLAPWEWNVGKGFSIHDVAVYLLVGKKCPGRVAGTNETRAEGNLTGSISLGGGTLTGFIGFDAQAKELTLRMTWSSPTPPTVLEIAQSIADEGAVAGSNSNNAVGEVCNAKLLNLEIQIELNKKAPRFSVTGTVAVFGLQVDLLLLIERNTVSNKWGFLAALEVPDGTRFDQIEPSKGAIAAKLGRLRKAHLIVTSFNTTYTFRDKSELLVSPGINFQAEVDMTGLAGGNSKVPSTLTVLGHWTVSDILLRADLKNFAIGDYVVLDAMAQFSTQDPIFWASGNARVKYREDAGPLDAFAEVKVYQDGDLEVIGDVREFMFEVGHSGLRVRQVYLNVTKRGSRLFAHFNGTAFFTTPFHNKNTGRPDQSAFRTGQAISPTQRPCSGGQYKADCAFDDDEKTLWDTVGESAGDNQWIMYTYDKAERVRGYEFTGTGEHCPSSWTLEASNVAGQWASVDTRFGETCQDGVKQTFNIPVALQVTARYYRWSFRQSTGGNGYRFREIKLDVSNAIADYAQLEQDATCKAAGFPVMDGDSGLCQQAAISLGHENLTSPLPTPESLETDMPSGCYVLPDTGCSVGWMDDEYGYMGDSSNLNGNQPMKGLTLTECVQQCLADRNCVGFTRAVAMDDVPADCYLKNEVLERTNTQLHHDVLCTGVDIWNPGWATGEVNREACQKQLKAEAGAGYADKAKGDAWCSTQTKEGYCELSCCEFWSLHGEATCGGTAKGARCEFPFTDSAGVEHNACTTDPNKPDQGEWCYTAAGPGKWGSCHKDNFCPPKMKTYRVRCPEPGYKVSQKKGATCESLFYSQITTKEWCEEARVRLRERRVQLDATLTEINETDQLPGCFRRGSSVMWNWDPNAVPTGADYAICYSGYSLWYNTIDPQVSDVSDSSAQPLCHSSASGIGMTLDVDIAGLQVNVTLEIGQKQSLTPTSACNSLADPGAMGGASIPSDFLELISTAMLEVRIFVSTKPVMIDIEMTIQLPRIGFVHGKFLVIRDQQTGKWQFALGISIGDGFALADLLPGMAGTSPDWMNFGSATLVVSSFQTPFEFMGTKVTYGVAISADLNMDPNVPALKAIRDWTGVHRLVVRVSFGFGTSTFRFEAAVYGRWYIVNPELAITGGKFFVEAGPKVTGGINIGLGIDLEVLVDQQTLIFQGEIILSPLDISFGARMATDWVSPFGLKAVTVGKTEVVVGIQYSCPETLGAPCPSKIGIGGGLWIAGQGGSVAVVFNKNNPAETLFAVAIDYFSLDDIIGHFTTLPKDPNNDLSWFKIEGFKLSVNPSPFPQEFNGQTYQAGIVAQIHRFEFLKTFAGGGTLVVNPTSGFILDAYLEPLNLLNGIIKIHGFDGPTKRAELSVRGTANPMVYVSGAVEIVGQKLGLKAWIDKTQIELKAYLELLGGMVKANLDLFAGISGDRAGDFSAKLVVEQSLVQYLRDHVTGFINDLKKVVNEGLDSAEDDLNEWRRKKKPKMDANNRRVAQIRAENSRKLRQARDKVRNAEYKVRSARNKVNGLLNSINNYKRQFVKVKCKWYKAWECAKKAAHNAWVGLKIAGCWVAHKAASAALWAAEKFLGLVRKGLRVVEAAANKLDPRILALQAENALINAAYKVAMAGLSAARAVVNGAADLVNFVVTKLTSLFDIRRLACEVAVVKGGGGSMGCEFAGIFVGKDFDLSFKASFPPTLESVADGLKEGVKSAIGM
eukprot:TRINITY_DN266_c0_g1_i3.p1 TRINITY_DN266_c0_g1~~TRINITY_DN266_c0_g1_i3.p1  ORF type:complete len:5074 (+),score=1589.30 TRINITY_DN266_c0_g1_i3:336-15224(+)